MSPESGSSFLSPTTRGVRMSIAYGRFRPAFTSEFEGRFLDRERFELENFLEENRLAD